MVRFLETLFFFPFSTSLLGNACCTLTLQHFLSSFMALHGVDGGKYVDLTELLKPGDET